MLLFIKNLKWNCRSVWPVFKPLMVHGLKSLCFYTALCC